MEKTAVAKYFNEVYTPVFVQKLAQLGVFIRDENDLGNLLKLSAQLKLAGVKSSLEQRSEVYKHITEKVGQLITRKGK
jgi:anti-anti-sigma regulatory factor